MVAAPLEQRGEPGLIVGPALVHLLMTERRREGWREKKAEEE